MMDGIVDITNDIEMAQSNVTLIRLVNDCTFSNHWLYTKGVQKSSQKSAIMFLFCKPAELNSYCFIDKHINLYLNNF